MRRLQEVREGCAIKRIGNLFSLICSKENCRAAILAAAEHKHSRTEVMDILNNLDGKAAELSEMLKTFSYKPSDYRLVIRIDGLNHKVRRILVPRFWPDQCVQHALIDALRQPLLRRMYYWCSGSIRDRGTAQAKRGIERATLHDQKHATYALQMDVRQCYQNIGNDAMMATLRRFIKDEKALRLLETVVRSHTTLPIGNYSSPWFCNLYLTPLDRMITEVVKPRHYVRYMDDIVLIDSNKRKLRKGEALIRAHAQKMGLQMHEGDGVFKVRRDGEAHPHDNRAIDFVGYRFSLGYTVLRRRNALRIMKQSRQLQRRIQEKKPINYKEASGFISRCAPSYKCSAYSFRKKYVYTVPIKRLKEVIRRESKCQQQAHGPAQSGTAPAAAGPCDCNRD